MASNKDEIESRLAEAAEALAGLPLDEQRRRVVWLLRQLDARAGDPDRFAAMLMALGTDIRQRVAMNQW